MASLNFKDNKTVTCFILLILCLVFACINSIDTTLDYYGKFSWYLDYSEGFVKRALPGHLLHYFYDFEDLPFVYTSVNESIKQIHIFFVCSFVCLLLLFYVQLIRKFCDDLVCISIIFLLLICSYFFKEIFDLTGYLDVIISTMVLLAYVAYHQKFYFSSVAVISLSCFISEISLFFWLPVVALSVLVKRDRFSQTCLLLVPIVVGFLVQFLSSFPETVLQMYKDSDVPAGVVRYIVDLFAQQYDILNLILGRFRVISDNFFNVVIGFCYLSLVSLAFFVLTLEKLLSVKFNSVYFKYFCLCAFFVSSFAPAFLIFVAVDFWRLIYFSVFSSFLTLLLICGYLNNYSFSASYSRVAICVSVIVSLFTLFSPPVMLSEIKMTVKNEALIDTIDYDYNYKFKNYRLTSNFVPYLVQDFYNNRNGNFDKVGWNDDNYMARICKSEGNVIAEVLASPGKKKILIEGAFADDDPDMLKKIGIWGKSLEIRRNQKNYFDAFFPHDLAIRVPVKIVCSKSSHDWDVKQFVILTVND